MPKFPAQHACVAACRGITVFAPGQTACSRGGTPIPLFMRFTNLATHPDIGANSYLLELGATRLVLDAGTHPKHTGRDTLPLYEELPRDCLDGSSSAIRTSITSAHSPC